jgi:SAM-dependent methyltransferase
MIMTNMLEFDADAARKVQAVYTTADVVRQREAVLSAVDVKPGEHVLEVGVGPGFLAAELAAAVGSSGRVCGIDISDDMLAIAARRSVRPGSARVELSHGSATEIPFDNESFDLVTCTQVLEYVSEFRQRWASFTVFSGLEVGCWCSTPTGTPSCGTQPTSSGRPGCLALGRSISLTRTCPEPSADR